jgi:hypothetical protein
MAERFLASQGKTIAEKKGKGKMFGFIWFSSDDSCCNCITSKKAAINFHTFPRKILNKNKNVSSSAVFQVRQTNLVRLFFRVPFLFIIRVLVSFLYLSLYLFSFKMSHLSPGKNSELLQHVGLDVGCTSKPP